MAQVIEGMRFATQLAMARQLMGISQEALANKHLGVTKATVGNWESGKTLPGFADLWRTTATITNAAPVSTRAARMRASMA